MQPPSPPEQHPEAAPARPRAAGYEYILEATVQIRPIYAADIFETVRIERWERQVAPALRDSSPPPCGMDLPCRMDLLEFSPRDSPPRRVG